MWEHLGPSGVSGPGLQDHSLVFGSFIHGCVCVCVSPQVDVKTVEDTAFGLSVLNSRVGPSLMAVSVMVSPSVQGYFSGTSQIVIITGFVYCDVLKEIDFYR